MDPIKILPQEVSEIIWLKLPLSDIQSCLLVSTLWYNSISNCSTFWRNLCNTKIIKYNSWKLTYLEEMKIKWAWRNCEFSQVIIDLETDLKLICCYEDFIYIINTKNILIKYNRFGELITTKSMEVNLKEISVIADKLILLYETNQQNEILLLNEKFVEICKFKTIDQKLNNANGKFWFWTENNSNLVTIYTLESGKIDELEAIYGSDLIPFESNSWVSHYNGEVHLLFENNIKKKIYAINSSPMTMPKLEILTNNKDIIVVVEKKIIEERHKFSSIHIFENEKKSMSHYLEFYIEQARISGDLLILTTSNSIQLYNLNTFNVSTTTTRYETIENIYNLFVMKNLNWIIIKYDDKLTLFDLINLEDLTIINDNTIENLFLYTIKFFITKINYKRLVIKTIMI
ncbi:hypothetical protein O3M35_001542 [Rhynocoris fuscipes]|uniref:F-box domain-containing protein n=1 Tax=Rhynocoris fuscipes TaxID=488301 RepID=A0AAW1CMV8_9HEMI